MYSQTTITNSNPTLYTINASSLSNIPTSFGIIEFKAKTSASGVNFSNLQINFV
jgi:hypothetical protein